MSFFAHLLIGLGLAVYRRCENASAASALKDGCAPSLVPSSARTADKEREGLSVPLLQRNSMTAVDTLRICICAGSLDSWLELEQVKAKSKS